MFLAARTSVDGSFFFAAQLELLVQCHSRLIEVSLADEHGDADLGCGDKLHVDAGVTQRFGEVCGNTRVRLHACTD